MKTTGQTPKQSSDEEKQAKAKQRGQKKRRETLRHKHGKHRAWMKTVAEKRKVETDLPLPLKAPPTGDLRKNVSEEKQQRVVEKENVETDIPLPLKAPPTGHPKKT